MEPATEDDENALDSWEIGSGSFTLVSEYHRSGRLVDGTSSSYLVVHDGSVTWDIPGLPQLKALHIRRDRSVGEFRCNTSEHALGCLAQHWLIHRGADPTEIAKPVNDFSTPANAATIALEHRLRSSPDLIETCGSYTSDMTIPAERAADPSRAQNGLVYDWYTWVVLDTPGTDTVRVLFEDVDFPAGTYTLSEGQFPDADAFDEWTRDPRSPLPPVPAAPPPRSAVATSRSPYLPGLVVPAQPPPLAAHQPQPTTNNRPTHPSGGTHR